MANVRAMLLAKGRWELALLLAVSVISAGCAFGGARRAYDGAGRPESETVTVEGAFVDEWIEGGGSMVALRAIDGQRRLGGWNGEARAQVELLPGEHVIGVEYHPTSGGGFLVPASGSGIGENLEVSLKAGERYVVYYSRNEGAFYLATLWRDPRVAIGSVPGGGVRCVPTSGNRARCAESAATGNQARNP